MNINSYACIWEIDNVPLQQVQLNEGGHHEETKTTLLSKGRKILLEIEYSILIKLTNVPLSQY